MSRLVHAAASLFAAASLVVFLGGSSIAPPQIIMLHGGGLTDPVFLTDLATNERLVSAMTTTRLRPRDTSVVAHVGFFYAPFIWSRVARDPARLRSLRASDADQVAELIVSGDRRTAVLDFGLAGVIRGGPRFRHIGPPGLDILRSNGVTFLSK